MNKDQFDTFVESIISEKTERPLLIIATAKIDDLLFCILSKYLYPKSSADKDDLLEGDQPIGSFSARIKLCFRLGLIDEGFYKILEKTRKIRNLGAHRITFNTKNSPIREHIYELQKGLKVRTSFKLTKTRYFNDWSGSCIEELQCMLVTICVILEAIYEMIKRTSGNNDTLSISKK